MAQLTYTLGIRMAWWWPLYLHPLAFLCAISGLQPDWAKFEKVCLKAMVLEAKLVE